MYFNTENPFGSDAFAAPASTSLKPAPRANRKTGKRQLPAAPSLKNLAIKLITL